MALAWWRRRKEHLGWKEQNTERHRGTNEVGPSEVKSQGYTPGNRIGFLSSVYPHTPSLFPLTLCSLLPPGEVLPLQKLERWCISMAALPEMADLQSGRSSGQDHPCFNSHLPLCPPPKDHSLLLSSSLLSWVLFFLLLLHFSIFL